ncbi:MAG: hypothetical protein P1U56_09510 [Saprospiraceae bacterium]|nr:hypothetical protein [Saprospiraceae bacterium]
MKNFLIYLFIFLSTYSFAQEYPKMVVEGATWMYIEKQGGPPDFFAYHIKGDTIINGLTYSILNDQEVELDSFGFLNLTSSGSPAAFMREDTTTKQVFAIIEDESILEFGIDQFEFSYGPGAFEGEYLLYDFGKEEGETLNNPASFFISEIIEDEMFGYDVRKFKLTQAQPVYEIFGDENGLFFPHQLFFNGGAGIDLVQYCVTNNYECSVFIETNSVHDLLSSDFVVYPNPTTEYISINVPKEKIQTLNFFALDGRLLLAVNRIDAHHIDIDLNTIDYNGPIQIVGSTDKSKFSCRVLKF